MPTRVQPAARASRNIELKDGGTRDHGVLNVLTEKQSTTVTPCKVVIDRGAIAFTQVPVKPLFASASRTVDANIGAGGKERKVDQPSMGKHREVPVYAVAWRIQWAVVVLIPRPGGRVQPGAGVAVQQMSDGADVPVVQRHVVNVGGRVEYDVIADNVHSSVAVR